MKALLFSLVLLSGSLPAAAQLDADDTAERARIGAQRVQAEGRLAAQEAACYKIFAANDCLKAARRERRERLSELRRQELALNEAQRKLKGAERLRSLQEREARPREEDAAARHVQTPARQADKEEGAAARAAKTAKAPKTPKTAKIPEPAASRAAKSPPTHDTAKALQQSAQRQLEVKERQERVAKRQAEAAKSGVKPLPVPQ